MIGVEQAEGRWEAVRNLTSRAEPAVADNVAKPCIANVSSLLTLALANVLLGDDREARRLQHEAEALGMEGYGAVLDPLYVGIAIARGDTAEVERKLSEWQPEGFQDVDGLIAWLNASSRSIAGRRSRPKPRRW